MTQKGGLRCSAAGAYLRPARGRRNLTVATGVRATRVLFEKGRAVGVEYLRGGKTFWAPAREVILCGGAVASPQLLLLSGVGPRDQLKEFGIPEVADLPGVGRNLQDHPFSGVVYHCTRPVTLDTAETVGNLLRLLLSRKGPLTSNLAEAGAFVRGDPASPVPDLQLYFAPAYFIDHGATRPAGHGFSLERMPAAAPQVAVRCGCELPRPAGATRHSAANYLAADADIGTLLARACCPDARRLPRRRLRLLPRRRIGCRGPGVETDAEMTTYLRRRLETLYHPVGTCKMGLDPESVVDPQHCGCMACELRVVGAASRHAHAAEGAWLRTPSW